VTLLEVIFDAADAHAVDRDACEDALETMLAQARLGEVTGAGRSLAGQMDLALEVSHVRQAVPAVRQVLRGLRVPPSTWIRQAGPPELRMDVYENDLPRTLGRARRAKRALWKPQVGQVFAIQLADRRWVHGRVTPQKHFYEFFHVVTSQPAALSELADTPMFRLRCLFQLDDVPGPLIGTMPYEAYEPQVFRVAYAACHNEVGDDGFLHCGHPDSSRVLTESEVALLPALSVASADAMKAMLTKHLEER
jgi:hypothetical protein